jgi:hypothetical protein
MTVWHPGLKDRLGDFPIHQQLLLVGNELNRAWNLREEAEEYKRALERALEILDMITDGARTLPGALRWELRRFREQIARLYPASQQGLETLIRVGLQLNQKNWSILGDR